MRKTMGKLCAIAAVFFMAGQAAFAAAIIDGGIVNGFDTFKDVSTGRIWLDMDSFFGKTTNEMVAAANSAGFTFATKADVQQLLSALPLSGGEWTTYKSIMMDAPNRELIWGAYDDGGNSQVSGWAYAYDDMTEWLLFDSVIDNDSVPNAGSPEADMNIWAYYAGSPVNPVPEPASCAVWGLGAAAAAFYGKRRKQQA